MRKYLLITLSVVVVSSIIILKKCNNLTDKKIKSSGLEYYEPNKFDDLEISKLTEEDMFKYVDSLKVNKLKHINLEEIIKFCDFSKDGECDNITEIKIVKNFGVYFVLSSTFSFMNKSYGVLYSEKEESEVNKYPVINVRFLRKSSKRDGNFYFIEAKI